jgi:hypothetical protein
MRRKKSPQMKLRLIADELAKAKCRARGYCQASGLDETACKLSLQWAHIVERSELGIRWSENNCLALCQAHHLKYTHRPFRWWLFIQKHYPSQWSWIAEHIDDKFDGDYEALIERLKGEKWNY